MPATHAPYEPLINTQPYEQVSAVKMEPQHMGQYVGLTTNQQQPSREALSRADSYDLPEPTGHVYSTIEDLQPKPATGLPVTTYQGLDNGSVAKIQTTAPKFYDRLITDDDAEKVQC